MIDFAAGQSTAQISDLGSGVISVIEGSALNFNSSSFSNITINGTSGTNHVVVDAVLTQPITYFNGGGGNDAIEVTNNGDAVFGADVGAQGNVALTIDAGGTATIASSQHLTALTVNGTASVVPNQGIVIGATSLNVAGKFDMADSAIAVDNSIGFNSTGSWNGSAYTGITGMIATGRNGGTWDGATGIVTSMSAAQSPNPLTTIGIATTFDALGLTGGQTAMWNGLTVDSTTTLIKYTYAGDANLSGAIDGDDYFAIDAGISSGDTGYANGDFNYDGRIDADDYFLIDSNYPKAAVAFSLPASAPIVSAPATAPKSVFADLDDSATDRRLVDDLL